MPHGNPAEAAALSEIDLFLVKRCAKNSTKGLFLLRLFISIFTHAYHFNFCYFSSIVKIQASVTYFETSTFQKNENIHF